MNRHLVLFLLLAAFVGSGQLIAALPELYPEIHHYRVFLYWLLAISIAYGAWLWRSGFLGNGLASASEHRLQLPRWHFGAAAAFVATLASPVLYETDPVRYYWDGISVVHGESPYALAPSGHPHYDATPWAEPLNYKDLPTIYPPAAQALFAFSTLLNPYFWGKTSGGGLQPGFWPAIKAARPWQAAMGWKLVMAVLAAAMVYLWRDRRWDLLLGHPLVLTKFMQNGHIDGVLMVLVMAATLPAVLRAAPWRTGLLLGLSIATKWVTALIVPFAALYQRAAGRPWRAALGVCVAAAAVTLAAVAAGHIGAEGKFFYSFKKFTSEWLFFGFWQRWVMDALEAANYEEARALGLSKIVGYAGILAGYGLVLWRFGRRAWHRQGGRQGLIGALALALLVFYSGLPVINPWYLLVLVPFAIEACAHAGKGAEIRVRLYAPMALTLAVSASAVYYYRYEDPIFVRYCAYGLVACAMAYDLWRYVAARKTALPPKSAAAQERCSLKSAKARR